MSRNAGGWTFALPWRAGAAGRGGAAGPAGGDPANGSGGSDDRRFTRAFAAASVCLLALLTGVLVLILWEMREATLRSGRYVNESLALVIQEQTESAIAEIDRAFPIARERLDQLRATGTLTAESGSAVLRELVAGYTYFGALWVLDASGRTIFHSEGPVKISDRSERNYYRVHRDGRSVGLNIGEALFSPNFKRWFIDLSRALRSSDGRFEGVIVGALEIDRLRKIWNQVELGAAGAIALVRRDGTLLMRSPSTEDALGKKFPFPPHFVDLMAAAPVGSATTTSPVDGISRLVSYRILPAHPDLVLLVGRSHDTILAEWWRFLYVAVAGWLVGTSMIGALIIWLIAVWRRMKESHFLFRQLAQSMPQIVYIAEEDGSLSFINERWTELTGQSIETLQLNPWRDTVHPEDWEITRQVWEGALSAKEPYVNECRLRSGDGTYQWHLCRALPVHNPQDQTVRWFGTATDIDDIRQAEHRVRARTEELEAVLEAIPAYVWMTLDPHARTVIGNRAANDLLVVRPSTNVAYRTGEAGQVPPLRLLKQDGREYQVDELPLRSTIASGRPVHSAAVTVCFADGGKVEIFGNATPLFDEAGRVRGGVAAFIDVTDRNRAERNLQLSEARQRNVFEQAADGIFVVASDDRYLDANAEGLRMLGYSREELLHLRVSDVLVEWEHHRSEAEAMRMLTEKPRLVEWEHRRKDGSTFMAEVSMRAHAEDQYVAIVRDMTARDAAEKERNEINERLRLSIQAGNVGLWDWDLRSNRVFFSREWKHQIGYADHEITSEFLEWESRLHPDDHDRVTRAVQAFVEKPEGDYTVEFRLRHKDGTYRWILAQAELLRDDQGKPVRMLGSHVDLTERKRMEEALRETESRLRAMADHSPMGITIKDRAGRYLFVNQRFCEWYGVEADEALGKTAGQLQPELDRGPMEAQEAELARSGHPLMRADRIVLHDGTAHDVEIVKFLLPGAEPLICSMATDVTEQRNIEGQLRQSQKMEAVGQLTGGIAHDFNNLLTVILGSAEFLTEALADDPKLRHLAEMVGAAGQRAADLTRGLLSFSRKQTLVPQEIDINRLVMHLDGLLRRTLGEQIEIAFVPDGDLWPAKVDRAQLEVALINLAVNARDAMSDGGKLTIETANVVLDEEYARQSRGAMPGHYVMIAVTDTGTGMTPEVLAKAFEPFFTTKEVGQGTGLGLSMVYGLVKQLNGHVKIYSEPDHGTTVKLYLPRSLATTTVDNPTTGESTVVRGGRETVLMVEDEDMVREHVEGMLKGLGFRVLAASDGASALAILRQGTTVDLLFTDVVMPGDMNGAQLADEARRLRPGLKVLYTTGYAENAVFLQGKLDRGVALLTKPYLLHDLAAKLRHVLDGDPDTPL